MIDGNMKRRSLPELHKPPNNSAIVKHLVAWVGDSDFLLSDNRSIQVSDMNKNGQVG